MKKEANQSRKTFGFIIGGLLLIVFQGKSVLYTGGYEIIPGPATSTFEDDAPTMTPWPENWRRTQTPTPTQTNTPSPTQTITSTSTITPTLITGVLTCNTVAAGVTCTNYGSYLDYNINIVVTGLTGGATASSVPIGTYKRSTNGGTMGMTSNFVHSETSGFA